MNEHVFGKHMVGVCSNPECGGIYYDTSTYSWYWFSAGSRCAYSQDNYGLQEENTVE